VWIYCNYSAKEEKAVTPEELTDVPIEISKIFKRIQKMEYPL
jgi:hypothetical protein